METGFRRADRQSWSARHHHAARLHLQRRRSVPRRAASGEAESAVTFTVATETGTLRLNGPATTARRDAVGDHRRLVSPPSSGPSDVACRRRDSARRAPLGLRAHEPRDARDAGRRGHRPGGFLAARRRSAVAPQGGPGRHRVRLLSRQHEGRRGALSEGRVRAGGQPGAADQRLPHRAAEGASRAYEPRASRSPPTARQLRGMPIAINGTSHCALSRQRGVQSTAGAAQSPAPNAMTTTGGAPGRQRHPQAHPTGYPIYRLEWRRWVRSSGGCATHQPKHRLTARRSWSSWSSS